MILALKSDFNVDRSQLGRTVPGSCLEYSTSSLSCTASFHRGRGYRDPPVIVDTESGARLSPSSPIENIVSLPGMKVPKLSGMKFSVCLNPERPAERRGLGKAIVIEFSAVHLNISSHKSSTTVSVV